MKLRFYFLALIWGAAWSAYLQFAELGRFLAEKRTWLTVVIGVGVDLLLLIPLIPRREWLKICSIIALSSVAIVFRSLWNELVETLEVIRGTKSV